MYISGYHSSLYRYACSVTQLLRLALWDPLDCGSLGSSVHAIFQVRTLEWIAIFFSRELHWFISVQSPSHIWLFAIPWTAAHQASLSITNSRSPPKPMSVELMMPSSHLILCHPLLLLPPIPPSIRVSSNESTLRMRWPKYWSFSFSISPSNGHPGLISFRMDWLDLLAVQGTLKSLLQHHSSKASILTLVEDQKRRPGIRYLGFKDNLPVKWSS